MASNVQTMLPRTLVCALLTGVLLGLLPVPAQAQTTTTGSAVEDAVGALRTDPVYVAPEAESILSDDDAEEVREAIAGTSAGSIFVAVFPEEARAEGGGNTSGLVQTIGNALARPGTYIVVAGSELRAASSTFDEGVIPSIADEAVRERSGDGALAVLLYTIERIDETATGESGGEGGGSGFGILPFLLLGGGALWLFGSYRRRRRREQEERQQLEAVRELATEDLVALGTDLRALDLDVEMPGADPAAKSDYVRALDSYQNASSELDGARRVDDVSKVTSTLEEGRYALASAQARLEGKEPPERRPPCFFDPRHGPSVTDVDWTPPGGEPRPVPACATDAQRVERGEQPEGRQIAVNGQLMPFWNAPYYYGPWLGGYFGGFGGLLPGLLIGSMLGGGMGFGYGFGGFGGGYGDGGYGGDGGDGGDGGGDFGGGDFGGGDFGGGDFG